MRVTGRDLALHLAVLALLAGLGTILPAYHHASLARIMVLAVFATGYNIAFGYTGLLSLGHAMFLAAGIYGAGLSVTLLGWPAWLGFLAGAFAGAALALLAGLPALRTRGVAFMIVTLMLAQAVHLSIIYFSDVTRGADGFAIASELRSLGGLSLADPGVRFYAAFFLFALALIGQLLLVRSGFGRMLIAMRENEERARMLGYDPFRARLGALVLSGLFSGASGAAYALLFGYAGAGFASIQYSILPLLWVLLGGAGTVLGPLIGTAAMFYMVDLASEVTDAYLFAVGAALVLLALFAPSGVLGAVRQRVAPWLP
ncbi:MAG TPA: branched-chain amino acid ABC transporter permease [Paracoccaceae bacterium]|nr:branched-chain amino acid ABC transporter permease [Paracoccaceae bacterium]